jgi:aryl carrier-like protein
MNDDGDAYRDRERRVAALSSAKRALLTQRLAEPTADRLPAVDPADPADPKRLVAYVVTRTGREARPGDLRAFLRVRLPEPLVPAAFVTLPQLPRTPSGKLDRRALPAPEPRHRGPILTLDDPEGRRLAALWAEVLGVEAVGEDDDFFELGGDSILVLKLCARARELGLPLTPRAVYERPTIRELLGAGPEARQAG